MPEKKPEIRPTDLKHRDDLGLMIGLTSLVFALLQSACTAFFALSGLQLLIGAGALASAVVAQRFLDSLHFAALRIPLEVLAIAGSGLNLVAVWRVRRLRARPSSQWRTQPPTSKKLRAESWQIGLAIVTLLFVALEWVFHIYYFGTI